MKSITFRLTLAFAGMVTVATALLLALGGWLLSRQMLEGMKLLHEAEFAEVRGRLEPAPATLTVPELTARLREHVEIDAALFYFQIHTQAGEVVFRSPNLGETLLPNPVRDQAHWTQDMAPHGRLLISEFPLGPWHVQIASPLAPTERLLGDYARVSALLLGMVVVVGVGLGYGFSRLALSPVRAIQRIAGRIRADNLSERIPVPATRDEIAALAELLNRMFDRLEISFNQVRRFTADASHELKTPLALIRLNAEKLRPRVAHDPEATAELGELLEEIGRLHQIIELLLFLAKADAGVLAPALRIENPQPFIAALAEDAAVLAEDRGLHFTLARNEGGRVRLEPTLLRQLLLNLVANALKVSPAGAGLTLASACGHGLWTITVEDEGPGLPADQLERVFERFVRFEHADGERSGHGLGLAICRSIAGLHGGVIRAENRSDRPGLRVTVELPLDTA
jgi:signal transduction histidine kinase